MPVRVGAMFVSVSVPSFLIWMFFCVSSAIDIVEGRFGICREYGVCLLVSVDEVLVVSVSVLPLADVVNILYAPAFCFLSAP